MIMSMKKIQFNFMGMRKVTSIVSALLIIFSISTLSYQGLNLGVDFTGGTLVEVGYPEAVNLDKLRQSFSDSEFNDVAIQYFGSAKEILIRIPAQQGLNSADVSSKLLDLLSSNNFSAEMRRVEFVGPQVGEELREDGGLAMLYALLCIMVYIAFRFQMRFSVGAVSALIHDVIITLGFFSITRFNFDLTILAALLAVIGYSLNDTIVVFDRVRENFRKIRDKTPVEVFNISLNQTLSRTLMTSFTTLLVLIALFLLGGEIIHGFSMALIFGVLIGTYSSIYIASPVTLMLGIKKEDLMPVKKEGVDLENQP
jgi:preprotein translocase subunit SecF